MQNTKKNTNTVSFPVYAALLIFLNLLVGWLFVRFIYNEDFLPFGGFYSAVFILCIMAGLAITIRNRRTVKNALLLTAIPYAAYCLIAFRSIWTIVICAGLLTMTGFIIADIFQKPYPENSNRSLLKIIRVKKAARMVFSSFGWFSMSLLAGVFIFMVFQFITGAKAENFGMEDIGQQSSVTFTLGEWNSADYDEKIAYAQTLVDYECNRLALKPLKLKVSSKLADTTLGYYSNSQSLVVINEKRLTEGTLYEVCDTISHECYHAEQYSLISNKKYYSGEDKMNKRVSERIASYETEFKDYKNYDTDDEVEYLDYFTQKCETDARAYSYTEAMILYKLVISNSN